MKKKSGGGEGGGANWMDTYGDMVTLLLCFFVLLYSMSTVDENKWKALVQSFNPNATPAEREIEAGDNDGPYAEDFDLFDGVADPATLQDMMDAAEEAMQQVVQQNMDQLYEDMKKVAEESGKNIEVTKGDNYIFVSFSDAVFFKGDDDELLPEGKQTLEVLAPIIKQAASSINEVRLLGHTAQATEDRENEPEDDRRLSATRSAEVSYYLQELCRPELDPARIVGQSYGQHRPVAVNDDENRWKNRRVEMIISGKDLSSKLSDVLEQYRTEREGGSLKPESSAPEDADAVSSGAPESGSESQEG